MKYLCIIQARTGSTRLPDKVLLKLEDKTVLEHVVERTKKSKHISDIVIATTLEKKDLKIVKLCSEKNYRVFCGSENDVLDRYYQIAKILKPENIVRITSDCPLIDYEIIDLVIEKHTQTNSDLTTNTIKETFPDGLDVSVIKFEALEKAWMHAKLKSEREHVVPYIINSSNFFILENVENSEDLYNKRWTLDTKEDFEFIKKIYENLYYKNKFFTINEILEFLSNNPDLELINSNIIRNEGYLKSLENDKIV